MIMGEFCTLQGTITWDPPEDKEHHRLKNAVPNVGDMDSFHGGYLHLTVVVGIFAFFVF